MKVAELMQRDVKTVDPGVTVRDLLVSLADEHVSAFPVVDRQGRMLGVVSNTDVIAAEAEADEEQQPGLLQSTAVADIMTPRMFTIEPDADVRDAAQQMLYAEVHRLFVARGDQLVGVISASDIVRAVAQGQVQLSP
ncbi:MAG TPA: CBS domain-containing protein [Gemmatimonadales bacterium]|nr:CBS domain-containing protein [Gemmatimonadales bacterium]